MRWLPFAGVTQIRFDGCDLSPALAVAGHPGCLHISTGQRLLSIGITEQRGRCDVGPYDECRRSAAFFKWHRLDTAGAAATAHFDRRRCFIEHEDLNVAAKTVPTALRFQDRLLAHQWVELGADPTVEQQKSVASLDAAEALGIFAMHADRTARKAEILSWRPA